MPNLPQLGRNARFLGDWTLLDPDQFGDCYFHVRVPAAATWEYLVGQNKDGKEHIIAIACAEAEANNFLGALATLALESGEDAILRWV